MLYVFIIVIIIIICLCLNEQVSSYWCDIFNTSATKLNRSLCSKYLSHLIMQYWTASTVKYQENSTLHWKRNSENRLTTSCFPETKSASFSAWKYYTNKTFLVINRTCFLEGTYFIFCTGSAVISIIRKQHLKHLPLNGNCGVLQLTGSVISETKPSQSTRGNLFHESVIYM